MTDLAAHVPPHSADAERGLLGSWMFSADAIADAAIPSEWFYVPGHPLIAAAILDLHESGTQVDPVTLGEFLEDRGHLEAAGGPAYIAEILTSTPHAAHAAHYAAIVREKAAQRAIIEQCRITAEAARTGDSVEIATNAANGLELIAERSAGLCAAVSMADAVAEAGELFHSRQSRGGGLAGRSTGFCDLDELTDGLQDSHLVILAARPGVGKTALATNVVSNVAASGVPVLFISLEMSSREIAERMAAAHGKFDSKGLRTGRLSDSDVSKADQSFAAISRLPIHILDDSYELASIMAAARVEYRKHGVRLIVVDYLQLIEVADSRTDNRERAVAKVSRSLKKLAASLGIPVMALSQINRQSEAQKRQPQLSDLRESGAIEQDANQVWCLHRGHDDDHTKLLILKNRSGATGVVRLAWQPVWTRFDNYASESWVQ